MLRTMSKKNFHKVHRVVSINRERKGVLFRCKTDTDEDIEVKIDICSDNIIRFCAFSKEDTESFMVVEKSWPEVNFDVREKRNQVEIVTQFLTVRIVQDPWQFCVCNREGLLIWGENLSDLDVNQTPKIKTLGFYHKGGSGTKKVVDSFVLSPDEHLYGLGEKFISLDKKGQRIVSWNMDALGVGTERAYKNIPFLMSTRGYGLFINTTCKIIHSIGTLSSVSYVIQVDDSKLDYYLIYGPKFKNILDQYTELTGKAPVPPKWSFGLWMSRAYFESREKVEEICSKLRDYDIPCDVINPDLYWMRNGKICDFAWDEERFPNPKEMISKIKKKGFKLCLWEHPYVSVESEMFHEGKEKGYFATKEDGSICQISSGLPSTVHTKEGFKGVGTVWNFVSFAPPSAIVDFSNPDAVKWYQDKHKPLLEMGVDVFKTDFGEGIPKDAYFENGMTGRKMHNLYALLYNKAVFEITEEVTGKKSLVWSRSAWAGSQRYPVHWAGDPQTDFASMGCVLRGGLSVSLSGVPFWSHDIGGFAGNKPNPKLYIRWAQFGLLTSHARCHGTTPREPWEFGEEALRIFRFYAKLRYRLIPYLYSYAYVANRTGLPIMRAMVLEYQDDPNTYDKDLQYMLGEEFLVAPIFDESDKRYVYLPRGRWIDYWTGDEYEGPNNVWYEAPLDIIPLFVKAGAIIPMGPEMSYVGEKEFNPITLDIYLKDESKFTLWDDNETITFNGVRKEDRIVLTISESDKTYIGKFNKIGKPKKVETTKGKVSYIQRKKDFDKFAQGWYFDDSILWVKISVKGSETLRIIR